MECNYEVVQRNGVMIAVTIPDWCGGRSDDCTENCGNPEHGQLNSHLLDSNCLLDYFLFVYTAFVCSHRDNRKKDSLLPDIDREMVQYIDYSILINCVL